MLINTVQLNTRYTFARCQLFSRLPFEYCHVPRMTASMDLILSAAVRALGAFHQKSPRQLLRISDGTTESHMMKYYNGPV